MAVVINEFEVVTEEPEGGAHRGEATGAGAESAASGTTPNDIRRILRRQVERLERVRAD